MIRFLLNESDVNTDILPGITVLDFIRYERNLTGTKIGCREGDCGACTVLVGELIDGSVVYRSATSCLMPLGNAHGKHIVTIEGINLPGLNQVQQAMIDEGATQCGFCTPGFVVSLAGFCLQHKYNDVISSIDGNICRCTGYKSIERAAARISELSGKRNNSDVIEFAVKEKIVPEYFSGITRRLKELSLEIEIAGHYKNPAVFVGGGTDLYVQKHEEMVHSVNSFLSAGSLRRIYIQDGKIYLDATATVTDLRESKLIQELFPDFHKYSKLVSSTPIRNMATIGGNFVNASPIGDFTVFFLALDAEIVLSGDRGDRQIKLRDFYKGYKSLDKSSKEFIKEIFFTVPPKNTKFNFEKVSKRTNLDIASVNSAINIVVEGSKIINASVSAGGVGPIPMFLKKTSEFLSDRDLTEETVTDACVVAGNEISPISDARGTADYKRFLLQQLIRAHFLTLFPSIRPEKLPIDYEEH